MIKVASFRCVASRRFGRYKYLVVLRSVLRVVVNRKSVNEIWVGLKSAS